MVLRGAFGDDEPLGDLPVGEALGDQLGDLGLAPAQRGRHARRAELRDERAGAVDVGRHAERPGEAVGVAGGALGPVAVARTVAGEQRRREVVARLGDEAGCPGPVGLLGRDREVVDRRGRGGRGRRRRGRG